MFMYADYIVNNMSMSLMSFICVVSVNYLANGTVTVLVLKSMCKRRTHVQNKHVKRL